MKKKDYNWSLLTIVMMAMLSLGLSSCGGDDDDAGGGSAPTSAGVLDKDSNKRVKSIGNYNFYYNDNGQINYITEGNTRYDFSYNPNKIVQTHRGEEEAVYTISYNGLGFITHLDAQMEFQEDGKVHITGSSTLSYDGTGHLISIKSSSTQNYQGKTKTTTVTATMTWQNSKLMSTLWEESTQQDGQSTSYYTDTYNYEYAHEINDYHNKHHQYAPSLEGVYGDEPTDAFAFVKLLGYGPLYLPIQCVHTWDESTTRAADSGSTTKRFSYGFNDDGSISYCTVNNNRYNYSYESLSTETRSTMPKDINSRRRYLLLFFSTHERN